MNQWKNEAAGVKQAEKHTDPEAKLNSLHTNSLQKHEAEQCCASEESRWGESDTGWGDELR